MPKLRKLNFQSFDEISADIKRLQDGGYERGGGWNLSQVCEHLAHTMRIGMHGGLDPAPWFMRAIVFRPIFEIVLLTGWMPSGAQAPPEITPDGRDADAPEQIDECLALLAEARDRREPIPPSPFVTGMHLKKWKRLQLIHNGHHLSFLAPKEA